jgi:hypothetical protein
MWGDGNRKTLELSFQADVDVKEPRIIAAMGVIASVISSKTRGVALP